MSHLNESVTPSLSQPMRIVWFGESIVSDWRNPVATTMRAVLRALTQTGHDVTFHEQRHNEPMVEALRLRGSSMYRAFQLAYPDIRYRTYDMPKRNSERTVWLARETAIAEAVIVQDNAPPGILEWLDRFDTPSIVTVLQRTGAQQREAEPAVDLILSPIPDDEAMLFGPAVLIVGGADNRERSGKLTVVYGDDSSISGDISAGSGESNLEYVPEALLPERYRQVEAVTIVDDDSSPFALARACLPVASGVKQVKLVHTPSGHEEAIRGFVDARDQANALVQQIQDSLALRRMSDGLNEQSSEVPK